MAGYTDFAFRKVCRTYGVALTVTEMVSSKALVMNNALTRIMLKREDGDAPCFCQIFGHEPQVMADSVLFPEVAAYEGVDINMGCPVHKIVSNGDGSALMEHPELAAKCISAVRQALPADKPLSVKFRLGVTDDSLAVDFAKMCRDSGADFVTVHFRTRKQMYAGNADFSTTLWRRVFPWLQTATSGAKPTTTTLFRVVLLPLRWGAAHWVIRKFLRRLHAATTTRTPWATFCGKRKCCRKCTTTGLSPTK